MFSKEALECYSERSEKPNDKRYSRVKSLAVETKISDCPFCSARHDIEECDELKKLPVNERSKVFFKKKLCNGCCQQTGDGHNSKNCTKRRKCRDCDGKYPTTLHGLQLKKNHKSKLEKEIRKKEADKADSTGVTCASTKMNQVISMSVVLVKVQSKISNTEVRTWILLDNCIQGSFLKKTMLEELKIEGKSTTVTVRTLNGDCKHSSLAVNDLEVVNIEGKQSDYWITLPRMFSQDDLPVASVEIATPENIQQWKYLHRIVPEMRMDRNVDVKLLIGANCLKALEPEEVISSQGDVPYAFKTKSGCCVVGPISDGSYQNKSHCNRITGEDHATGKVAKHHFAIPKDVKQDRISDLLKKLYAADFMENQALPSNGTNEKLNEVSAEDITFLK